MIISQINLANIRLFEKRKFNFGEHTTLIVGDNATGKTNLLESIFLLSIGRSFRADKDSELVSFENEVGRITAEIIQLSTSQVNQLLKEKIALEIVITKGEVFHSKSPIKKYLVNGVVRRMIDFIGHLKVVHFWPQDMDLVTDSPSLRRRYLDFVLMQTDREYRRSLISYEKGLRQRNKVLEAIRERQAHHHQLIFWDQLLIKNGDYITKKREEYLRYLNNFQLLKFNFQLFYDKSIISRIRLDQYSKEEIAAAVTLVGPHRDDFIFQTTKNKRQITDLSHYGSRGEQRLSILWLKLGELSYLEKVSNDKPVLLLDDIFSELDHDHRNLIFNIIGNQQTIITTTDIHLIDKDKLKHMQMIEL